MAGWTPERRQEASERLHRTKPWLHKSDKPRKSLIRENLERHEAFLLAFYGDDSPTKGNKVASAKAIGYSDTTAETQAARIFARYDKRKFQDALRICGVSNILMAYRLRRMIENGADKDAINAIRLALAAKGEATDQQAGTTINNSGPVMVIVGASSKRIEDLRKAVPQLSKEQEEEIENERCQQRLEALKRGELPLLPAKSRARPNEEEPLPSEPPGNAEGAVETQSDSR